MSQTADKNYIFNASVCRITIALYHSMKAFQEFNRIDGQIQRSYHEAAVKMGLPDSEFWILYVLATNEPEMLQTELTAITGVSKTTINSALKKMERAGLLELTPGGGRNTCARLTETGHQLAEKTVCRLVALENRIYESWSPEEQAMLIQLNRDYSEKLAAMIGEL